jgi:hypothetical protein
MNNTEKAIIPFLLVCSAFVVAGPRAVPVDGLRDAPRSALESLQGEGGPYAPAISVPVSLPAPSAAPAGQPEGGGQKEWTILVFLNAKNDLESFGMGDMNEMERVGSGNKFNVVVQLGRSGGYDTSDGNWSGVRRYYMVRDEAPSRISSPVLEDLGAVDMGDYRELVKFVNWGKGRYPAEKYLLIVWNHGAGWPGISFDDDTGGYISTPQLAQALAQTGGVDVMATDACLMQMAEVAYELKDFAKYIVGSEETIPGRGYGYHKILRRLKFNSGRGAESMGSMLTRTYGQYMVADKGATLSSLDASQLPELARLMDGFARTAMASDAETKNALKEARDEAYAYAEASYKDLARFAKAAVKKLPNGELKTQARQLSRHITRELVDTRRRNLFSYDVNEETGDKEHYRLDLSNKSKGVSAYIPDAAFSPKYSQLSFARDTQWDEFVQWLQQP